MPARPRPALRNIAVATAVAAVGAGLRWAFRHAPRRLAARIERRARIITSDQAMVRTLLAGIDPDAVPRRPTLIVNPSKLGAPAMRDLLVTLLTTAGAEKVEVLETTITDSGQGQGRAAVANGSDLVVAVGGDGTVRAVAAGIAGSRVPLGIIPLGTGNLFARNLGASLDDLPGATRAALFGTDRPVDVGRLRLQDRRHRTSVHTFLVIAGMGLDAAMVADTPEHLKAVIGWPAYLIGAARNALGPRPLIRYRLDNGAMHVDRQRSVMAANCGALPAGIELLPGALMDDGLLDFMAANIRMGPLGWVDAVIRVLTRRISRTQPDYNAAAIFHVATARHISVRSSRPLPVQADGEWLGRGTRFEAWVEPHALVVRA